MRLINPYRFGSVGPTDPNWANVVALLHMDGVNGGSVFPDAKGLHTWSPASVNTSTTQSKFGGSSAYFAGGYLEAASHSDWDIATDLYTIETQIRPDALALQIIVGRTESSGASTGWLWLINSTGLMQFLGRDAASNVCVNLTSAAGVISAGTFQHVSVNRDTGGAWYMSAGGVIVATTTESAPIAGNGQPLQIGRQQSVPATRDWVGYQDEVRFTRGACRYNANFTPPTAAFPDS